MSAKPKTKGEVVKEAIEKAAAQSGQSQDDRLSVALVGNSNERERVQNIFHVLKELKLAKAFEEERILVTLDDGNGKDTGSAGAVAAVAFKDKHHENSKPVNPVKVHKKSGQKYLVELPPSVIISITGDAQDMLGDGEFFECVDDVVAQLKTLKDEGRVTLELNREAASRAIFVITANSREAIRTKAGKAGGGELKLPLQISKLLRERMEELDAMKNETFEVSEDSNKKTYKLGDAFKNFPSVRDIMLDVFKDKNDQFKRLTELQFNASDDKNPVIPSKRLHKSR
jgi:hypothetical protein